VLNKTIKSGNRFQPEQEHPNKEIAVMEGVEIPSLQGGKKKVSWLYSVVGRQGAGMPQNRRNRSQKEVKDQSSIKPGTKWTTSAGLKW